jgi:hypothetical protein
MTSIYLHAGHLLGRVVRQWKSKVKLRGWPHKVPTDQYNGWLFKVVREICGVFLFLGACQFMKSEIRSLFNFFLSSFVCPMLRFWLPQVRHPHICDRCPS